MPRPLRRWLLGPALAIVATGATLTVDIAAADAATNAFVRVSGTLKARSGPTNGYPIISVLRNRAKVSIACQVTGQYVRGSVRRTAQWDRLTNGRYISHAYVSTRAKIAACAPDAPAAPVQSAPSAGAPAGPTGTMSNAQFLAAAALSAQQSQRETRVPASVTIAQAILESGWGRSALAVNDRNFFGMKCFSQGSYANGCHVYATSECTPAGVCSPTTASFRAYATATDSFRDHGALLSTASRYAVAMQNVKNPNQFVIEIHKAGYATDPLYAQKLVNVMTTYNLYQYDLP
jgi:flagellum-specific peptidoglycan hydrolase FlgJ